MSSGSITQSLDLLSGDQIDLTTAMVSYGDGLDFFPLP